MHEAALTERGRRLFPNFQKFKNFYLVGGTALALQIGHRQSVDFDMFTSQPLSLRLLQQIKQVFRDATVFVTYHVPGQLNVTLDGIKATFFEYPYPVIEPFVTYEKVNMLSMLEISATKAYAIGQRISYKDYVDWYYMLSGHHVTLQQTIDIANKKYGHDFNDRLFLGQLVSLDDVADQPIEFLGKPVSRGEIGAFLKQAVRDFGL